MNKEKMFIEGYEVGFLVDTTGAREKKIQVASGEIVSIDERFIYKSIEREKVTIPQFVADVIEGAREQSPELEDALHYTWGNGTKEFTEWYNKKSNRDLFARAWLDGYEVEKEKRYLVKIKGVNEECECLVFGELSNTWKLRSIGSFGELKKHHTRKELEEAGFGWIFDCEGVEVQEVE